MAAADRDADAMVGVVLELETAVSQWAADTDEDQGTEQARALLRSLISRLGRTARDGLADPRDRLAPAVEPLLALRATPRGEGNYAAADTIRDALAAAGLDVSDTQEGTPLAADRAGLILPGFLRISGSRPGITEIYAVKPLPWGRDETTYEFESCLYSTSTPESGIL